VSDIKAGLTDPAVLDCTCTPAGIAGATLSKVRILLAEDDSQLREVLERSLREAGYVVDSVPDGNAALRYLLAYEYALCVVDWRMPGMSGLEVVADARLRGLKSPILMLTARDAPADRVRGLDQGADDYLVKPFDHDELLARVRALLRRSNGTGEPSLKVGGLVLTPATREVTSAGELVDLTPREFAVLELLMRKAPAVVSRRHIALQVWPEEADALGSNTIDVHMARLRAKLARSDARIATIRGTGYRVVQG
jgi:DNA-binding response OmpR family regulator